MKYTIRELEVFSVIGQEVELTNYQKRNIQISTQFWRPFGLPFGLPDWPGLNCVPFGGILYPVI